MIISAIFFLRTESAAGAGLEFFGGFIRYRVRIPIPPFDRLMLLIVKGPPDSVVIFNPGLKGACLPGEAILGYGVKASRGILPIFGMCQPNLRDPYKNLYRFQPDLTLP